MNEKILLFPRGLALSQKIMEESQAEKRENASGIDNNVVQDYNEGMNRSEITLEIERLRSETAHKQLESEKRLNDSFSALKDEISEVKIQLSKVPSTWTIAGMFVSVFIGIIAVLTFGADRFSGGLSLSPIVSETNARIEANTQAIEANKQAIQVNSDKLDLVIEKLEFLTPVE